MACVNRSMAALPDLQWQDAVPHGLFHFLRPCLFYSCPWLLTPGSLLRKAALSSHLFMTDTSPPSSFSLWENTPPERIMMWATFVERVDNVAAPCATEFGAVTEEWESNVWWMRMRGTAFRMIFTFLDERVDGQQSPPSYWQYARLLMVSHQPSPSNGYRIKNLFKRKTADIWLRNTYRIVCL